MEDFLARLIIEKQELQEKADKLRSFLGKGKETEVVVGKIQFALLHIQIKAMDTYLECLGARIKDLED